MVLNQTFQAFILPNRRTPRTETASAASIGNLYKGDVVSKIDHINSCEKQFYVKI